MTRPAEAYIYERLPWQTRARWFSGWRSVGGWIAELPREDWGWRRAGLLAIRDELAYLGWHHWRGYQKRRSAKP